ncbi:MAG TPA: TolC family protein [Candidatus Binatia bacterium]|nr:TolC family protein [Candidatus Binatia bacterium]
MFSGKNAMSLVAVLLLLSGCTSIAMNAGFNDVKVTVEERSALQIFWNNGSDLDKEAAGKLASLLEGKLTAEQAVQVGLLNNRELQAAYSDLGIAQADLVQAGLLNNPIFDASVMFPVSGGGRPDLELSAAMNFLNIFYIPLRRRVAAARFEEVKTRVTGSVLDFAGRVRSAFYRYQAAEQMLELRQAIVQALDASFEIARRLSAAGNITDLDLARERAQFETSKLALRSAEVAVRQNREELNILMGLWGKQTQWQSDQRLPEIPEQPVKTEHLERLALEKSMDLLNARQRIMLAGNQLGFNRWTALLPELHTGALGEREEGSWELGPTLEFPIPLFDRGQARVGRAAAELRSAQQQYYAFAVRIRSTARAVQDRMEGARDRALYYRDILLPLHERIVNEAQLQYNAMQLGPRQLLNAREQQIETAAAYIEALREYWLARGNIGQLIAGRLPTSVAATTRAIGGQNGTREGGGH